MPRQSKPKVTVSNGMVTIELNSDMEVIPGAWFFDRSTFDEQQVEDNMRLAFQIGNFSEPASVEFRNAVNGNATGKAGMQLNTGSVFIKRVTEDVPGICTVGFGPRDGEETYTLNVAKADLGTPPQNPIFVVARNIRSFLRLSRFSSWNDPGLKQAIEAKNFWY